LAEPILYETDAGLIVVQGEDVLVSERAEKGEATEERLRRVAEGVRKRGIS
jgi:hypothetical protein